MNNHNKENYKSMYICPMHPDIVSDQPGKCPKCGMSLVLEGFPVVMPKKKWKDFLPIIVIFSSIFLFTATAIIVRGSWSTTFAMRMMMGSFFLIFGGFKIFNLRPFADAYSDYDILAKRSRPYALVYPFIELTLAGLYLSNVGGLYRDIFTLILMTVSSIGVIQKVRRKEIILCACLGMVFKIPMTWVTLIEDLLMALEALLMIFIQINR